MLTIEPRLGVSFLTHLFGILGATPNHMSLKSRCPNKISNRIRHVYLMNHIVFLIVVIYDHYQYTEIWSCWWQQSKLTWYVSIHSYYPQSCGILFHSLKQVQFQLAISYTRVIVIWSTRIFCNTGSFFCSHVQYTVVGVSLTMHIK